MPIYGIIGILRAILNYNLAKYQYLSTRLRLVDKYHQVKKSLQFPVQYHVKYGLNAQKNQKNIKNPFSQFELGLQTFLAEFSL